VFFIVPVLCMILILPASHRYNNKIIFQMLDWIYKGITWSFFTPLQIINPYYIPQQHTLFIANHQSSLDIPLLGQLMRGRPHIWYAWDHFSKIPVFGIFIRRMCIPVGLSSVARSAQTLVSGIRLIEQYKTSALIFPEGGRYTDNTIHPFFSGFAVIAKKTGMPVVPILLQNPGNVYPPKSFWIYREPIKIIIGKAVWYQADDTQESFTQHLKSWFIENSSQSDNTLI
jgi:1-acyl-sn-glycerol-3-phosphate acyltransferase